MKDIWIVYLTRDFDDDPIVAIYDTDVEAYAHVKKYYWRPLAVAQWTVGERFEG